MSWLCPFVRSLVRSCTHAFIHSFTHSFIHSFTHSLIHAFIHSIRVSTLDTSDWSDRSSLYPLLPAESCNACSVYARAFREGFTVTLVSGRTVGIGAYLARLGRRSVHPSTCIQNTLQSVNTEPRCSAWMSMCCEPNKRTLS